MDLRRSKTDHCPEPPQKKKPVLQRPVRKHAYSDEMNDLKTQKVAKDDEYTKILKKCLVDVNILYNSDVETKDIYLDELIERIRLLSQKIRNCNTVLGNPIFGRYLFDFVYISVYISVLISI